MQEHESIYHFASESPFLGWAAPGEDSSEGAAMWHWTRLQKVDACQLDGTLRWLIKKLDCLEWVSEAPDFGVGGADCDAAHWESKQYTIQQC